MNAKDTINAVKSCDTIEAVNDFLTAEKSSTKPRKTVIDACEERIGELTTGSVSAPEKSADETPAETPAPVRSKSPKQFTEEDKRVMDFNKKIPYSCRAKRIKEFAEEFFGEDLKSAKIENFKVFIVLKSGRKIERQGV